LRDFPGSVDAIIGYMDFPVSTMLPILRRDFDLPGPTLESLLKCEHKYWSRLEQQKAVPEVTPAFAVFDPFVENPAGRIDLAYPFWVKPVKSAGSWLGFRVGSDAELHRAVETIRRHIGRFGDPFDYILEQAELPPEVARVRGNWCIAEQIIGGRLCTVEGYILNGTVGSHGTVDSILYPGMSSFFRYQYPSRLPGAVQRRMLDVIERFLTAVGFDNSAFNIEFFWDETADKLWLLEINTRVAQHHSELFEKVDGLSNHQVTVDVALGREPRMPHGRGRFKCAAACWLRRWNDGVVRRVPSGAEIAEIQERIPGTVIELEVREGMRLSDTVDQDSYSYVLALIYLGGKDEADLIARYEQCVRALHFEIEDAPETAGALSHSY
ncbi:MAG: D-alanine--D-alanine ligase, partial [Gammaproteobacteria bacterium]